MLEKITGLIKVGENTVKANSPIIFTALGTAGFITTVCMAIKAAPKASARLEEAEVRAYEIDPDNKLACVWEKTKAIAPLYGPVVGVGAVSLGCFYASNHIMTQRNAVLAAAASLSERALLEYQEQVVQKLGEAAHNELLEAVAEATDERIFEPENFMEGDGDTLCYDKVTGRYFTSSPEKIREAEATIVKRAVDDFTVKLNDFYYELGLDDVSTIGEAVGWDISKIKPDIRFSSMLDEHKRPCLVLNYHVCMLHRDLLERTW